ncbi:hypothetical protein [Moheibacter stercoris]|uniref:Uncharacterized protein n=1 Tax=Moheibacter stercoris TaxID=1628251 RepID=A0ABV2LU38_9FLAO
MGSAKKIIDKILSRELTPPFALSKIESNFKSVYLKEIFLKEFEMEIKDIYLEIFKSLKDSDFKILLDFHKKNIIEINIDENTYLTFKHFCREINGQIFISDRNTIGLTNNFPSILTVIKTSDIIRETLPSVCFLNKIDLCYKLGDLESLFEVEKFLLESSTEINNNLPIQTKELHNNIFKGNALEMWQTLFENFQITESSRTDVKFIYEEMKKDGFIFNTVSQKSFLEWISDTYQISIGKTSNHSRTGKRLSIYSNAKLLNSLNDSKRTQ